MRKGLAILAMAGAFACGDGKDGKNGEDGASPAPCTVAAAESGAAVISCPDGTKVEVPSCAMATNDAGKKVLRCSDGTETELDEPLAGGSITVEARLQGLGEIAGIRARLRPGDLQVSSDAKGRMRFEDVPVGIYELEVDFPGYQPQRFTEVAILPGERNISNVVLPFGNQLYGLFDSGIAMLLEGGELLLKILPNGGTVLHGTLTVTSTGEELAIDYVDYVQLDSNRVWFQTLLPETAGSEILLFERSTGRARSVAIFEEVDEIFPCDTSLLVKGIYASGDDRDDGIFRVKPSGGVPQKLQEDSFEFEGCWEDAGLLMLSGRTSTFVYDLESMEQRVEIPGHQVEVHIPSMQAVLHEAGSLTWYSLETGEQNVIDAGAAGVLNYGLGERLLWVSSDGPIFLFDPETGFSERLADLSYEVEFPLPGFASFRTAADAWVLYRLADGERVNLTGWTGESFEGNSRWMVLPLVGQIGLVDLEAPEPQMEIVATTGTLPILAWVRDEIFYVQAGKLMRWVPGGDAAETVIEENVGGVQGMDGLLAVAVGGALQVLDPVTGETTPVSRDVGPGWRVGGEGRRLVHFDSETGRHRLFDVKTGLSHELGNPLEIVDEGPTFVWTQPGIIPPILPSGGKEIVGAGMRWTRLD